MQSKIIKHKILRKHKAMHLQSREWAITLIFVYIRFKEIVKAYCFQLYMIYSIALLNFTLSKMDQYNRIKVGLQITIVIFL